MKKGKLFYHIFIPIFLVGSIIIIAFSSYVYFLTKGSLIDEISNSKKDYILQAKNSFEQNVQNTENIIISYSTRKDFQEIVKKSLTVKSYNEYNYIASFLSYLNSMGFSNANYSLVSLSNNWEISNNRLNFFTEEEINSYKDKYFSEDSKKSLKWVKDGDDLSLINSIPAFSTNKNALIIAKIDNNELNKLFTTSENNNIQIINKDGEIIYNGSDKDISKDEIEKLLKNTKKQGVILTDKSSIFLQDRVAYVQSEYNDWIYSCVISGKEIGKLIRPFSIGITFTCIFLLVVLYWFTYYFALKYTKPIKEIEEKLPKNLEEKKYTNELVYLTKSFDNVLNERDILKKSLEISMPQLETQFNLNLFRNRLSKSEINTKLSQFNYHFDDKKLYYVLTIEIDSLKNRLDSEYDIFLLATIEIVKELIEKENRLKPVVINDKMQSTILCFDEEKDEDIQKKLNSYSETIMTNVKNLLKIGISIGVSNGFLNLKLTKRACEESKQALEYKKFLGKESIIFYRDISNQVSTPAILDYPFELEKELFENIRIADIDKINSIIKSLLLKIKKGNNNPLNFEISIIRLVNNLIQFGQSLQSNFLLLDVNKTIYHKVMETDEIEIIEKVICENIIYPLSENIKNNKNEQFKKLGNRIKDIVVNEYNKDISLESIAERLHYNPNYLSSVFKKEYGVTFSEYLKKHRIDAAKFLLKETTYTIKDIAEQLQYKNSQNFIRTFKKLTDMTPGEYRKNYAKIKSQSTEI